MLTKKVENGLQQKVYNKLYQKIYIYIYILKNYIQQKCIQHKPNLYIIINVCNKNVDNKNVCKVHKRRYIEQKRIHLCSTTSRFKCLQQKIILQHCAEQKFAFTMINTEK